MSAESVAPSEHMTNAQVVAEIDRQMAEYDLVLSEATENVADMIDLDYSSVSALYWEYRRPPPVRSSVPAKDLGDGCVSDASGVGDGAQ